MPIPSAERLQRIRDFPALLAFLAEDLHWHLPEDPTPEDTTFDWDADELHLAAPHAARLRGGLIRQLRPLHLAQPWGVFFVEFNEPRLYRTALRQILRRLVPNRRRDASLQSWLQENLLFVCATRDYRQITFAHFRGAVGNSRARLATFGWDDAARGLRTLREFNLPALTWPPNPANSAAWLDQWTRAFDVEPVTREFFRVYREVFTAAESAVIGLPDPDRRRLWTQRLFNRLMFIAFIEKKGWLTLHERTDYLATLWETWNARPDPSGLNFYNARLRHLFFQLLNNPAARDLNLPGNTLFRSLLGSTPYLNGGLFEQDTDDADPAVTVPDAAFTAVFRELFERFNFTVTESTPLDIEVAVDPEMLGKVFEELVTGRHESGSYYTPKPIVAFMCREALKHFLAGVLPETPVALARFVDAHDPAALGNGESVLAALRRVRVCDPACGSGAYLLGMLHELLDLRACLFATGAPDAASVHARKLEIIQHNLYGVDLDPFAVNIARLRLWLSLAVEYEGQQPPPLPNLDFKIESGDSLAAPDPQRVFVGQGSFRDVEIRKFQQAKAAFLLAHGPEKRELRAAADASRADLRTWLQSEAPAGAFDWAVEFAEVFAPPPALGDLAGGLNLGDTLAANVPGGFDIIVANPPFVRMELIKPLKPMLRRNFPAVHDERTDLYVYFYARAQELLRPGGIAAFISSNKWLRAGYGEKLRRYLLDAQAVHLVADFGELPVFQAVAILTAITIWEHAPRGEQCTRWVKVDDLEVSYATGMAQHFATIGNEVLASQFGPGKPRVGSAASADLRNRMEQSGPRLGEICHGVLGWGVKTGHNAAFCINQAQRDQLVAETPLAAEIIKPLITGDDVRAYETHYRDTHIIYAYHSLDIHHYPSVENHLRPFRSYLNVEGKRVGLDHRATRQNWYELQQPQMAYRTWFEGVKIIYPEIGKEARFTMEEYGRFLNNKCFFLPSADWFLLGVLNSKLTTLFLRDVCSQLLGGVVEFRAQYLAILPIPDAPDSDRATVAALAREAQRLHTERRARVERFLRDCGLDPADSTSRNLLEMPWSLPAAEFSRRRPRFPLALHAAARDETAAATDAILRVEADIDARVAALYGL